jgi:hypothetical protein
VKRLGPAALSALAALTALALLMTAVTLTSSVTMPVAAAARARTDAARARTAAARARSAPAAAPAADSARATPPRSTKLETILRDTRLVSFFPPDAGWTAMWTHWSASAVEKGLARLKNLGANTVRVVIDPWTFGYPDVSPTMAGELATMVGLARKAGLYVQLTLFDWWDSYGQVPESESFLGSLLRPYIGDDEIRFIELKNEIHPADPAAMVWARQMLKNIEHLDPATPVTLSISSTEGPAGIAELKDALGTVQPTFYDLHYYGPAGFAHATLAAGAEAAAPSPLFVGETGYSTSAEGSDGQSLSLRTPAALDAEQALYLSTVELATKQLGLPPAGVWTLDDVAPATAPRGLGLVQYGFGLYRANGSPKPAAAVVRQFFTEDSVPLSFDNGFETVSGGEPVDWQTTDPAEGSFAADHEVAQKGKESLRISRTGGSPSSFPGVCVTPVDAWAVPGRSETASVWSRGKDATGDTKLVLAYFAESGALMGEASSSLLPVGTTTWTKLSITASPPRGAATLEICLQSAYDKGAVWFDDVTYDGS